MDLEVPHFAPLPQRSSLRIFLTSLQAFLLREMRVRFGQSRLGYVWGLLDPAATTVIFVLLHTMIRGEALPIYGENPVYFFMYGCVAFFMFMHAVTGQQNAISSAQGLFNYRQIRPIDILLARSLLEWGLMLLIFLLFALAAWLAAAPLPIENLAGVMATCLMLLALGFSLGLCFEVFGAVFPDLRRVVSLVTRPLFFISGTFYTIDSLPDSLRPWLLWNPVLHLVDLMRGAALLGYDSPGSWTYAVLSTAALLFLGLAGYRRYLHRLI